MFDLLGMNKLSAAESVREIMTGATRGLLEGFEWRLDEKDRKIKSLEEKINKLENENAELEEKINKLKSENAELEEKNFILKKPVKAK